MHMLKKLSRHLKVMNWARHHKALFIVGHSRTGTTVLERTIKHHPEFISTDNIAETAIFMQPWLLLYAHEGFRQNHLDSKSMVKHMDIDVKQRVLFKFLPKEKLTELYDTNIQGIDYHIRLTKKGVPYTLKKKRVDSTWYKRQYKGLIRHFFYLASENQSYRRIIEKTPGHRDRIPQIMQCFPRGYIIYCLRDPVEILASLRRKLSNKLNPDRFRDQWLQLSAEKLVRNTRSILKNLGHFQKKYPNQVILSLYDQFTQNPEEHTRWLLEKTGVDDLSSSTIQSMLSARYTHDDKNDLLTGEIRPYDRNPKEYLEMDEIRLIYENLDDYYNYLGLEKKYL